MRTRLDYSRSVSPSVRGSQSLADIIAFSLDRDLSKRWGIGFSGSYNMRTAESDVVGGNLNELNRDQIVVGGSLSYRLTSKILLLTEYRFTQSLISLSNEVIDSNALFISLSYLDDPHVFSGY